MNKKHIVCLYIRIRKSQNSRKYYLPRIHIFRQCKELLIQSNEAPAPASATEGDDPLGFLRTQPQFAQMRTLVQQNPSLLPAVLQQLGEIVPPS